MAAAGGLLLTAGVLEGGAMGGGGPTVVVNGEDRVVVERAARPYGLSSTNRGVALASPWHRFAFTVNTRRCLYQGDLLWLHRGATVHKKDITVSPVDWNALLLPMITPEKFTPALVRGIVVLDPGHGGQDRGAVNGAGLVEKDLALEVCLDVRDRLEQAGVIVHLTRDEDVLVPLTDRPALAGRVHADLFVSLHFNQAANRDAAGIETYVLPLPGERSTSDSGTDAPDAQVYPGNTFDGANAVVGRTLHHHLLRTLRAGDRGMKRARFVVVRDAPCPAALLECGFLSNSDEAKKMASPHYRKAIAEGVAAGIQRIYRLWETPSATP